MSVSLQPWRRMDWTLPDWIAQAWVLEHNPRHSRQIDAACARHIARFPHELVGIELDTAALLSLRALLHQSRRFGRPHRGRRAGHWTTAAIMETQNQLARLTRLDRRNSCPGYEMYTVRADATGRGGRDERRG